jgi:hypothetical protein
MATRTKTKPDAESIRQAYISKLLTDGKPPHSIFAFAQELGLTESEFYSFFSSFESIEKGVWTEFMKRTLDTLQGDESFANFSTREKLLAFFYSHIEMLKAQRSYVSLRWPDARKPGPAVYWLKEYKDLYLRFAEDLVAEGIEKKEIKERAYLSERYAHAMWFQLLFVVDFWVKDRSEGFDNTDAAIEKAVNLLFQLLTESTLDSAIDLAKFLWQSR